VGATGPQGPQGLAGVTSATLGDADDTLTASIGLYIIPNVLTFDRVYTFDLAGVDAVYGKNNVRIRREDTSVHTATVKNAAGVIIYVFAPSLKGEIECEYSLSGNDYVYARSRPIA
jgi:hypothetical protein